MHLSYYSFLYNDDLSSSLHRFSLEFYSFMFTCISRLWFLVFEGRLACLSHRCVSCVSLFVSFVFTSPSLNVCLAPSVPCTWSGCVSVCFSYFLFYFDSLQYCVQHVQFCPVSSIRLGPAVFPRCFLFALIPSCVYILSVSPSVQRCDLPQSRVFCLSV